MIRDREKRRELRRATEVKHEKQLLMKCRRILDAKYGSHEVTMQDFGSVPHQSTSIDLGESFVRREHTGVQATVKTDFFAPFGEFRGRLRSLDHSRSSIIPVGKPKMGRYRNTAGQESHRLCT